MTAPSPTSGPLDPHRLYVHVAWSTLARVPAISPERRPAIETHIMAVCRRVGADPIEARALGDRIHLIVRLPVVLSVHAVATRVRQEVAEQLARGGRVVRWSPGFAAVSVAPADVRRARKRLAGLEPDHETLRRVRPLRGRGRGGRHPPG